jgi:hypothetical protein
LGQFLVFFCFEDAAAEPLCIVQIFYNESGANLVLVLQLGFDAFFFARADYQDLQKRRKDQTMEVIWQGSKSLGSSAQVLQTVSKFASQNFAVADQMLLFFALCFGV